jgi:hypothetical protein
MGNKIWNRNGAASRPRLSSKSGPQPGFVWKRARTPQRRVLAPGTPNPMIKIRPGPSTIGHILSRSVVYTTGLSVRSAKVASKQIHVKPKKELTKNNRMTPQLWTLYVFVFFVLLSARGRANSEAAREMPRARSTNTSKQRVLTCLICSSSSARGRARFAPREIRASFPKKTNT